MVREGEGAAVIEGEAHAGLSGRRARFGSLTGDYASLCTAEDGIHRRIPEGGGVEGRKDPKARCDNLEYPDPEGETDGDFDSHRADHCDNRPWSIDHGDFAAWSRLHQPSLRSEMVGVVEA